MASKSPAQLPLYALISVQSEQDLDDTKSLFRQYAEHLGFSLEFQNFDEEMAAMPGKYAPPTGDLLLARDASGNALGCVGLRPLSSDCCEMKRLYVLPSAQGLGVGGALAAAVIARAEELGYREMRLDTLPRMVAALKMYRRLGFVEIPAYYNTPMEGTHFLSLKIPRTQS